MSVTAYSALIFILCAHFIQQCDGYGTKTQEKIKFKFIHLIREIYFDARAKIAAVQYINRFFNKNFIYDYATLIYNIRVKIRMMVLNLRKCEEAKEHFYRLRPNELKLKLQLANDCAGWTMDTQILWTHVDHLVQLLIEAQKKDPSGTIYRRSGPLRSEPKENESKEKQEDLNVKQAGVIRVDRRISPNATMLMLRQKQMEFLKRKKMEWAMARGVQNLTEYFSRKRDKYEEGFASDLD